MFFDSYAKGFSLQHNVHVLIIYAQAVLDFAKEIADDDLANLSDADKQTYLDLAEQLEQLSFEAGKLRVRVKGDRKQYIRRKL